MCGILHCNLSRDVILLENISSSDVLVESETAIRTLGQHLLGPLRGVENLGLDFLGSQGVFEGMVEWNRKPECERAMRRLAGGFGLGTRLRGVWVFAAGPGSGRVGDEEEEGRSWIFWVY